jgi:hypothetical protein
MPRAGSEPAIPAIKLPQTFALEWESLMRGLPGCDLSFVSCVTAFGLRFKEYTLYKGPKLILCQSGNVHTSGNDINKSELRCIHAGTKSRQKSRDACYHSDVIILSSCLLSKNVFIKLHKSVILVVVSYGRETWFLLRCSRSLCRWGETISQNCGHQRIYCSSPGWYISMERGSGMILTEANRRTRWKCHSALGQAFLRIFAA